MAATPAVAGWPLAALALACVGCSELLLQAAAVSAQSPAYRYKLDRDTRHLSTRDSVQPANTGSEAFVAKGGHLRPAPACRMRSGASRYRCGASPVQRRNARRKLELSA